MNSVSLTQHHSAHMETSRSFHHVGSWSWARRTGMWSLTVWVFFFFFLIIFKLDDEFLLQIRGREWKWTEIQKPLNIIHFLRPAEVVSATGWQFDLTTMRHAEIDVHKRYMFIFIRLQRFRVENITLRWKSVTVHILYVSLFCVLFRLLEGVVYLFMNVLHHGYTFFTCSVSLTSSATDHNK